VNVINALMRSKEWKDTAEIIAWDDSDGWYDHQMGTIVTQSNVSDDQLLGPGSCGSPKANHVSGRNPEWPLRLRPALAPARWANSNFIDDTITDQSSILRLIEDNWNLGRIGSGSTDAIAGTLNNMFNFSQGGPHTHGLILDPQTGTVVEQD
jgi:phospholipase C